MAFAPYEDAWDGMGRRIARDREPSRASLPPLCRADGGLSLLLRATLGLGAVHRRAPSKCKAYYYA